MWWIVGFYAEPYSYVVLPRPDTPRVVSRHPRG
jgi:hypothetical protein